ncbi:MAG: ATP-binding protein [Pseudomonadota bacterium]
MWLSWLKAYVPRSLIGRTALILLVPIITIQLVVSFVFIQRLYENVTVQMTQSTLLDVRLILTAIETAPNPETADQTASALARSLEIRLEFPAGDPPRADTRIWYDLSGRVVTEVLRREIDAITGVDLATVDNRVTMGVSTGQGIVEMTFSRRRVSASNPHQLLVLMVCVSLIVTVIAFLFLRNQVRPIRRLAEAAEAFGRGRVLPYRPSGATEVRAAGSRFLDMRARIERHLEQRTLMLSGVSHDLRTPLTRLKLGLTMMTDSDEIEAMERDVKEMEEMIDSFLAFSRDQASEDTVSVDPAALVQDAVEDARRAGGEVELGTATGSGPVEMRATAVKRALDNLIGNALRYGQQARVSVAVSDRAAVISVEDDGPGIAPSDRDEALKPFARLDRARNQNRGTGVGLGLAIASDVARQHGGALRLGTSKDLGGLKADIVLAR